MKIEAGGRVYEGTAKQVVQQMRSAYFVQTKSLQEFVAHCVENADAIGVKLAPEGGTDDAICEAFVAQALEKGLFTKVDDAEK